MPFQVPGGLTITGPGTSDVTVDVSTSPYESGFKFNTIPFGGMTIDSSNSVRIGSAGNIKLVPSAGYSTVIVNASLSFDLSTGNSETIGAGAYSGGTLTVDPTKLVHYFSVNDATAYNISKIVGSGNGFAAGQMCVLIAKQAGAGSVTMTDANTAAVVNDIHFKGNAVPTVASTKLAQLGCFFYGDPIGAGVSEWWELMA